MNAATRRHGMLEPKKIERLRLAVLKGPDAGLSVVLDAETPIGIGTGEDNGVVLRDPTVSRYHVEVGRGRSGITVRDLGSLNGTHVGDVKLDAATVPPGTSLKLGATVLRVDDAGGVEQLLEDPEEIPGVVGRSEPILAVRRTIRQLAATNTSVLIEGETGTGKEVAAQAIHRLSPRAAAPFVEVDCGSMPATLIASELFGHERGAFTGADRRHVGAFERARGGTLFLDEIGELPLQVQTVLLGVLERRKMRRLGGEDQVNVDVRVLAATNRDLRAEVNKGSFRADLFYRLAIAKLRLPPLRERPEDIPLLVQYFVEQLTAVPQEQLFGEETLALLQRQPWSGNVRELRNVVESALAMGSVRLDAPVAPGVAAPGAQAAPYREARAEALAAFERAYLTALMESCGGNASEAARRARMDRPYLLSLLRRHDLR